MSETKNKDTEFLATTPYSLPCPKCGSSDIHRRHRVPGTGWTSCDFTERYQSPWIDERYSKGEAKKECIDHKCRCCGYRWQTEILGENDKELTGDE